MIFLIICLEMVGRRLKFKLFRILTGENSKNITTMLKISAV